MKENIVISGIGIFQAGALSIYKEFLETLHLLGYTQKYNVTIFVYRYELFQKYNEWFSIIEMPKARKNYLYRLYYEYIFFYFYSRKRKIDIWFSMHDTTPNVKANRRYVYCHNPLPFFDSSVWHGNNSLKEIIIQRLYRYVYKINIKKNTAVIVQQEWIRKCFYSMYGVDNVIVARPSVKMRDKKMQKKVDRSSQYIFFYPAYPRNFKNFEVIGEACRILEKLGISCEVWLTLNGNENKYAHFIKDVYGDISIIKWCGILSKAEVETAYEISNCLLFPSLLETWGLPITEYKMYGKPMICADLPYAHETVGDYKKVNFFPPKKGETLAQVMIKYIQNEAVFDSNPETQLSGPEYKSWEELITAIME